MKITSSISFYNPMKPASPARADRDQQLRGEGVQVTRKWGIVKVKSALPQHLAAQARHERLLAPWLNAPSASPKERRTRQQAADSIRQWFNLRNAEAPLNLSGLQLTTCPPIPAGAVSVNLSNNRLQALPHFREGVVQVDFSNNGLTTLPDMRRLPNSLRTLDMTGNQILTVPDGNEQNNNRYLNVFLGKTGLSSADAARLHDAFPGPGYSFKNILDPKQLSTQVCQHRIQQWSDMNNPEHPLDLSGLNLTKFPTVPEGVQHVNFSNNELTELPDMRALPRSLRQLDLKHNRLSNVPPRHAANDNRNLRVILGNVSFNDSDARLLEAAEPGPNYSYTLVEPPTTDHAGPRACYELKPKTDMVLLSMRQTKAT